jgi:hypothetical protein
MSRLTGPREDPRPLHSPSEVEVEAASVSDMSKSADMTRFVDLTKFVKC